MSYVPNADVGGNFVTHMAKWLQLRALMDDMKYRKERQAMERQQFQMDVEDRNRRRAHDDFTTALTLQKIGALPAAPGDTGQNDEAIAQAVNITPENRRRPLNTPIGNYRLPSEADTFTRSKRMAVQEGTLKGLETQATENITNPNETIALPEQLGGGTAEVKKTAKIDKLLEIYKVAHPKLDFHATPPNDSGDVTIWSSNPMTNEIRTEKVLSAAGKTKTVAQGALSIPDFDSKVKALMDQWRPGHYAQLGITQDVIDEAKGTGSSPFGGTNPAATRIQQAENTLYQRAKDSLTNTAKGARTSSSRTTSSPPVMPAANVPTAAQRKGMTVEQFRKWFADQGGVIQ